MKFAYKPGMILWVKDEPYEIVRASTVYSESWCTISLMELKTSILQRFRLVATDGLTLNDISYILNKELSANDVLDHLQRQIFIEATYSIGDKFKLSHATSSFPSGEYLLCAVDDNRITLVNLETGNRFCNPVKWEGYNTRVPHSVISNDILKNNICNVYSFKRID